MTTCEHCSRTIEQDAEGIWVDPEAPATPEAGDDYIWRETCDSNDSFTADHEPEDDDLSFNLQALIDSGDAWRLEGSIGRQCMAAIEDGVCTLGPVGHRDYYGNYVPAIHEVKAGSLGSLEYAEARR